MAITTPPFRTSLLTANGIPFATDNGDIQTTREWWMYWNQLTDRSNANSKLATAGTHADRPMPDGIPEGALYYENDRGVLYASTLGVWQYVAGVMWGTLVPDQRPTDLATHDAGFDFRTSVAPPREFIWSQTAWVEVTPQVNTAQIANASASLTLTTSATNIPGCTLTLAQAGTYLVIGIFYLSLAAADQNNTLIGTLSPGGTGVAALFLTGTAVSVAATVSQQWLYTAAAGAVISLQAFKSGGAGGSTVIGGQTSISALWVSP